MLVLQVAGCQGGDEREQRASGQPYAGLEKRAIKALSRDRVADLLAGRGAGYALAAELNHYPGPMHVLDLAEPLELTASQEAAVRALDRTMHERAKPLGRRLVRLEARLDRAFRARTITERELADVTAEIGRVEARLRSLHLEAHVRTRRVLSVAQVARYDRLRGYARGNGHRGHEGGEHG